jgi:hypothetical protein
VRTSPASSMHAYIQQWKLHVSYPWSSVTSCHHTYFPPEIARLPCLVLACLLAGWCNPAANSCDLVDHVIFMLSLYGLTSCMHHACIGLQQPEHLPPACEMAIAACVRCRAWPPACLPPTSTRAAWSRWAARPHTGPMQLARLSGLVRAERSQG